MDKQINKMPLIRFPDFKEEWREFRLSELMSRVSKSNKDEEFSVNEILSLSSTKGIVDRKELLGDTYDKVNHKNYIKTRINDLVYGKSISASYPYGLFKVNDCRDGLLSTLYFTFKVNDNEIPAFFDRYFSYHNRANNFLKKYVLVGDRYITADANYILSGKIFIPQKAEQQKIASFFKILDIKIEQLKQKKRLLIEYKKGIMQKIFSQDLRFKDENGNEFPDWEEKKLVDILTEKNEKTNSSGQHRILSSTAKGIFNQDDYFTRDIASKDNTGYKILRKYQLVFSPQNLWLGNINVNMNFEIGIVSPSYKIFSFDEKISLAEYFQYFLLTPKMMFEYEQSSTQGASVVRRNLDMERFFNIDFLLPSIEEQKKIAAFLVTIDDKISRTQAQVVNTQEYKKGLLQKMFV